MSKNKFLMILAIICIAVLFTAACSDPNSNAYEIMLESETELELGMSGVNLDFAKAKQQSVSFNSDTRVKTGYENIALKKTVIVSKIHSYPYNQTLAVDGNSSTAWGSSKIVPETDYYICVDLGEITPINGIGLYWFGSESAMEYSIFISNDISDQNNWNFIHKSKKVNTEANRIDKLISDNGRSCRYIAINLLSINPDNNFNVYGLREFEIYQKNDPVVSFTDSNFEAVVRLAIEKPTGDIFTSDLSTLEMLDVDAKKIGSLDGLSYFTNLKALYCNDNPDLSSIDLSNNPLLEALSVSGCRLTNLDIFSNIDLVEMDCINNQLTSLDTTNNNLLTYIDATKNQFTTSSIDSLLAQFLEKARNGMEYGYMLLTGQNPIAVPSAAGMKILNTINLEFKDDWHIEVDINIEPEIILNHVQTPGPPIYGSDIVRTRRFGDYNNNTWDNVYALSRYALFHSYNNGLTWERLPLPIENAALYDFACFNNKLYLATARAVYWTANNGLTWNISYNWMTMCALGPHEQMNDPNNKYLYALNSTDVYRTKDGITWEKIHSIGAGSSTLGDIYAKGSTIIISSMDGVCISTDDGETWSNHLDNKAIWSVYEYNSVIYAGDHSNDILYITEDYGTTWNEISGFDGILEIYANDDMTLIGTKNGVFVSSGNLNSGKYFTSDLPGNYVKSMNILGNSLIVGTDLGFAEYKITIE